VHVNPSSEAEAHRRGMHSFVREQVEIDDHPSELILWLFDRQAVALVVAVVTGEPLVNVLGVVAKLEHDRAAAN
jgi:hypothetical protein